MATAGKVQYEVIGGESFTGDIQLQTGDFAEYILNPPDIKSEVEMQAGVRVPLRFTYSPGELTIPTISLGVGYRVPVKPSDVALQDASNLASKSDVSIVFVGTTSAIESEGYDRKNLKLPDGQDQLVESVAATSKKTIVVVNAGSPVEMPWFDKVDAVLISWFPGQQMGNAIADVIYGVTEPGGRLPTTWPVTIADVPVLNTDPVNDQLDYSEGVYIGYRGWHKSGKAPRLPFGFGLGYTTFTTNLDSANEKSARVSVKNTGSKSGSHVIQIYAAPEGAHLQDRKLIGFAKVTLAPNESTVVGISYPAHVFDEWSDGWKTLATNWDLTLAEHSFDAGKSLAIEVR